MTFYFIKDHCELEMSRVRPLSRHRLGYITADQKYVIHKTKNGKWKIMSPNLYKGQNGKPLAVSLFGGNDEEWKFISQPPFRKLSDVVKYLEGKADIFKVRPLAKRPRPAAYPAGQERPHISYMSSCGHFVFTRSKDGWSLNINLNRANTIVSAYGEGLLMAEEKGSKAADWQLRHGLDLPLATLKEAVSRLEKALQSDPPLHLHK